jgi:type IV pilus assembly protein PilA
MIVVVIVGVLATLAVAGYRKIVNSSHVAEATSMVQNIRVAQEAYHSETQQYANISSSIPTALSGGWYPANPVYGVVTGWGATSCSCTTNMNWQMLPLHVDGPVLFGYATTAGGAGSAPNPTQVTVNGSTVSFPNPSTSDWYLIAAAADLDGNSSVYTSVYGMSWTNQIFVSNEGL